MRLSILFGVFVAVVTVAAIPAEKPPTEPPPPAVTSKPRIIEKPHDWMIPQGPTTLIRLKDVNPNAANITNGDLVIGTMWRVPNVQPTSVLTATPVPETSAALDKRGTKLCQYDIRVPQYQIYKNIQYVCTWLQNNDPVGWGDFSTSVKWENWPRNPATNDWPQIVDQYNIPVISTWNLGSSPYEGWNWEACFNSFFNTVFGCTHTTVDGDLFGAGYYQYFPDTYNIYVSEIWFRYP